MPKASPITSPLRPSLSVMQAADHLALGRADVVALIDLGEIASFYDGWNRRVCRASVLAYSARLRSTSQPVRVQPAPRNAA